MSAAAYVLIRTDALGEAKQPIFHEYRNAGHTECGRGFYISDLYREDGEEHMAFCSRRHAEKFARPCKRCSR